jgi:TM2 domain-containing membrane protein YozV
MKEKEVWVTYLLWFFFGLLGVHKFYLGKMGWGIVYILTGGLFFIGWFVDLFLIPGQVRQYNEQLRAATSTPAPSAN